MNDARPTIAPIIVERSVVQPGPATPPGSALSALVPAAAPSTDPEFDAYLAIVKSLLGGAVEGTAELARRIERLEADMRASEAGPPGPGEVNSAADVVRYMLFGASLAAADGLRQRAVRLAGASDVFLRVTGSAVTPFVGNRLTRRVVGPFDRAFGRLAERGQQRVNEWVELGRANEPAARLIARRAYLEAVDDFIGHLSQNQQLSDLVQEQSVGLATEFVEEVRERTVSADTLAESIVRRILKRPPRTALPPPLEIREAVAEVKRVPRYED